MIVSRALPALRLGRNICLSLRSSKLQRSSIFKQQIRHAADGMWTYRTTYSGPPLGERKAYFLGVFFWWWMLWHLFTEYEEFMEPHFPDPSKWTDEELGIPPM